MGSTILQLCQDACDEPALSLGRPSTLFASDNNGDDSDRKLLRALTATCRYLQKDYDWQVLAREASFETVAQQSQPGVVPSDWLRFVPDTFWNRTARWKLAGPISPQERQQFKAWYTGTVVPYFWQQGDAIQLFPVPDAGLLCSFEYIANAIGYAAGSVAVSATSTADSRTMTLGSTTGLSVGMTISGPTIPPDTVITALETDTEITLSNRASATLSSGAYTARTPRVRFSADTDVTVWEDELIVRGIVWQYRKGERLDYAQDQADFEKAKADVLKQDGGRRKFSMNGRTPTAQERIDQMRSAAVVIRT